MATVLAKEQLSKRAEPLRKRSGIYILFYQGDVVYVGQSVYVEERISVAAKSDKRFDSYAVIECSNMTEQEIADLQAEYIVEYNPIYNTTLPTNRKWAAMTTIRRLSTVNFNVIKRHIRKNLITDKNGFYRLADFVEFLPTVGD